MIFVLLELILDPQISHWFNRLGTESIRDAKFDEFPPLDLGISDADATVVATASLLLIASLNVAVAVSDPGSRTNPASEMEVVAWGDLLSSIARLAAVTTCVLALTRMHTNPGLALTLGAVAWLALLMAAATKQRQRGKISTSLSKRAQARAVLNLHDARKALGPSETVTPSLRRCYWRVGISFAGTFLVWLLSATVVTIVAEKPSVREILDGMPYLAYAIVQLSLPFAVLSIIPLVLQIIIMYFQWVKRGVRYGLVGLQLAWLMVWSFVFYRGSFGVDLAEGIILWTFIGAAIYFPLISYHFGENWRFGPRRYLRLLVAKALEEDLDKAQRRLSISSEPSPEGAG